MTKTIKKRCSICKKFRRTTNLEIPFVCENPCLRVDARKLILQTKGKAWEGVVIIFLIVLIFIVGYLVGKVS